MTSRSEGVAYRLWECVDRYLYDQRMTQKEFCARSGVPAMTLNRLKTQTRPPRTETIHALADAMGIDRDKAAVLAGRLRPTAAQAPSVEDAIMASELLTKSNKRTMIELFQQLAESNTARIASSERATPSEATHSDDEDAAM